jgi:cytochrome c oxidase cbb3-type subunit I/II
MPIYAHLSVKDLDYKSIPLRVKAQTYLGVPYTQEQVDNAQQLARAQAKEIATRVAAQLADDSRLSIEDKQVVALIAYMQRLGMDLFKPAPAAPGNVATTTDQPAQKTSTPGTLGVIGGN